MTTSFPLALLLRCAVVTACIVRMFTPHLVLAEDDSRSEHGNSLPLFDPIVDAPVIRADEARDRIRPDELVLGVVAGGEARAYPINMLTGPRREIINDTLGGDPIAATWCNLCHDAVVYRRKTGGRVLTFCVSGTLWKSNLVMMDVETDSQWVNITGRAIKGEMKDAELESIPSDILTWKAWLEDHPDTTVLNLSRTSHDFQAGIYYKGGYELDDFCLGATVAGEACHVSFATMARSPVLNFEFNGEPLLFVFDLENASAQLYSRRLDGRLLRFERRGRTLWGGGSSWNLRTGQAVAGPLRGNRLTPVTGIRAFTRKWLEFHPDSREVLDR